IFLPLEAHRVVGTFCGVPPTKNLQWFSNGSDSPFIPVGRAVSVASSPGGLPAARYRGSPVTT
ncbi:MAG: hypothetical protein ABI571_07125, partial [Actinomycetota bacterium]